MVVRFMMSEDSNLYLRYGKAEILSNRPGMQIPTIIQRKIPHPPDVRFSNPIGNRSEIWHEWYFSENLTNLARMSIQIIHFEERIPQTEGTAVANELQDGAWDLPWLWGGRGTALFFTRMGNVRVDRLGYP
jgi:hypothetical protein